MRISDREQSAIREVLRLGAEFGYGNLIAHLQTRWAETLMNETGLSEKSAREATARDGSGYPFKMQLDLLLQGQWDETGKRYQEQSNAKPSA